MAEGPEDDEPRSKTEARDDKTEEDDEQGTL